MNPSPLSRGANETESSLRRAVNTWLTGLDPELLGVAPGAGRNGEDDRLHEADADGARHELSASERATWALEQLVGTLQDAGVSDSVISDLAEVASTFASIGGAEILPLDSSASNITQGQGQRSAVLTASKRALRQKQQLLKGYGLPVHETSIGRRASASYCVYERLGGWETLSAAVEALYNKLLRDARVASYFHEAKEAAMKTHMLEFMSCAFGGKERFAGSALLAGERDQLRGLGFAAEHFDIMLQHLKAVLDDLSVPKEVAASALALLRCNRYLLEQMPYEGGFQQLEVTAVSEHLAQA